MIFRLADISFFITLFLASVTFAQTPDQWVKLGNKSMDEKDFYGASVYYLNAFQLDSSDLEVAYLYADALRLYNEYRKALQYFQYVYERDEKKVFSECLFWMASMQKYNADYAGAKENFKRFMKAYKANKNTYIFKKARQEVKSCEFALKLIRDTLNVNILNLGSAFNTVHSEFAPFLVNDSTLYFSTLRTKNDTNALYKKREYIQVFEGKRANTQWESVEPMDTLINSTGVHSANTSISYDKQRLFFSRCSDNYKCAIYISELKNGQWQSPSQLPPPVNMDGFTSTQPMSTIMDDKEVLLFVSDRPQGKGKLDIWYTTVEDGKYDIPVNLGSKVNTIDDEITPFYDTASSTLYFSSNWHWGLGGFDVFKTTGKWKTYSIPENMGYPFNSSVNDYYFSAYPNFREGFFTSNRKGSFTSTGETCCNDIYSFNFEKQTEDTLAEVIKYISLEKLNQYLPVTLYFHNDEPNPKTLDTLTNLNYMTTYLEYSKQIEVYKKEYSRGLTGEEKHKAEETIEDFFSDKVDKGIDDLEIFTKLLLKELEKGQKIILTTKGYASPLAKSDYNVNLTLRRISSLVNYFQAYDAGVFLPYLNDSAANGGSLSIVKIPYGEYKADVLVSDNLNDKQNSVYSRAAALERKIEIMTVTQADKKENIYAAITFDKEIHDFGELKTGDEAKYIFAFTNTGNDTLQIKNMETSCGCTLVKWTNAAVAPNEKGEIEVEFDTNDKNGKQIKTITIYSNAKPEKKVLTITAEIK